MEAAGCPGLCLWCLDIPPAAGNQVCRPFSPASAGHPFVSLPSFLQHSFMVPGRGVCREQTGKSLCHGGHIPAEKTGNEQNGFLIGRRRCNKFSKGGWDCSPNRQVGQDGLGATCASPIVHRGLGAAEFRRWRQPCQSPEAGTGQVGWTDSGKLCGQGAVPDSAEALILAIQSSLCCPPQGPCPGCRVGGDGTLGDRGSVGTTNFLL